VSLTVEELIAKGSKQEEQEEEQQRKELEPRYEDVERHLELLGLDEVMLFYINSRKTFVVEKDKVVEFLKERGFVNVAIPPYSLSKEFSEKCRPPEGCRVRNKEEDFEESKVIWLDIDDVEDKEVLAELLKEEFAKRGIPVSIADSGHGLHIYARLAKPVQSYDELALLIKGLAHHLNEIVLEKGLSIKPDSSSWSKTKLMRLIGTINLKKTKEPAVSKWLIYESAPLSEEVQEGTERPRRNPL